MARILSIDYGAKRTGLAISDSLGMIANGLDTVATRDLMKRLEELQKEYGYKSVVIGQPKRMSGAYSNVENDILQFISVLKEKMPGMDIQRFDERFTSKMAMETMLVSGAKKKKRAEKGTLDKISATIILQEYLNSK